VGRPSKGTVEDEIAEGRKEQMPKEISYFLYPASARRPRRPSREPDDSMDFNVGCFLPKISLGFEAPVEKADNPVLQAFDINSDEGIQVFPKRRNEFPVFFEPFDESLALVGDVVHGFLDSHPMEFHEDNDHVPSFSTSLFDIVRCDILPVRIPSATNLT